MPVLPGPCALLRYRACLADGGVDEYLAAMRVRGAGGRRGDAAAATRTFGPDLEMSASRDA